MSYLARASRTGVEKVAVAIVLSRRRRQGCRVDASAVPTTPRAVGLLQWCKGEVRSRLQKYSGPLYGVSLVSQRF